MSKSFVLTHRYSLDPVVTLGVDDRFLYILAALRIDVSELSQEEHETFLGLLSILYPGAIVSEGTMCSYILRYI